MKKILFLLVCLTLTGTVFSSDYPREFAIISQAEYDLKNYAKDPEAAALVLYDKGESSFFETNKGYDIRFTRSKRIKIFKKAGIEFSEITIPFYVDGFGTSEKIVSILAVTYNYENNIINKKALEPSTIYEVQINERWRAKKFTFPDVNEGSIIEYTYVLETPFHFNLPDWTFQDRIPTLYSECTLRIIPFYEYSFIAQGISKFDYQNSSLSAEKRVFGSVNKVNGKNYGSGFEFNDMVSVFVMRDVPAFKDEAYITSTEDYIMKIDFQLSKFKHPYGGENEIVTTWPKLIDQLLRSKHFGEFAKKAVSPAKKTIKSMPDLEILSEIEKSRRIIEYVRSNFSWNGRSDKYTTKTPKEFVAQKTGNSAEINLYLCTLLKEAGIQASPVILSTRNHGKIKTDYPFSHFFNYVIVLIKIDDKFILTDGTENHLAYNRIPPRCMNDAGLIIEKKMVSWVELNSNSVSVIRKQISMVIDPEKNLATTMVNIQTTEFESFNYKDAFKNDTITFRKHIENYGFDKVHEIQMLNLEKSSQPYLITFKGELPVDYLGDKLMVSPFLNFPDKENKLKQNTRNYPVDFIYAKKEEYNTSIKIPSGYRVFSLPEKVDVRNDLVEIYIEYIQNDDLVELKASYTRKKAIYLPNEYKNLKYYLDLVTTKFNEQLVFMKG